MPEYPMDLLSCIAMRMAVDRLFVVKRRMTVEILYYCPNCESINEVLGTQKLDELRCKECQASLTAEGSTIEAVNPPAQEQ